MVLMTVGTPSSQMCVCVCVFRSVMEENKKERERVNHHGDPRTDSFDLRMYRDNARLNVSEGSGVFVVDCMLGIHAPPPPPSCSRSS